MQKALPGWLVRSIGQPPFWAGRHPDMLPCEKPAVWDSHGLAPRVEKPIRATALRAFQRPSLGEARAKETDPLDAGNKGRCKALKAVVRIGTATLAEQSHGCPRQLACRKEACLKHQTHAKLCAARLGYMNIVYACAELPTSLCVSSRGHQPVMELRNLECNWKPSELSEHVGSANADLPSHPPCKLLHPG